MTVVVARSSTPESEAALAAGLVEAKRRGEDAIVFHLDGDRQETEPQQIDGVSVTHRFPQARGRDATGDLLDVAEEVDASLIVVGIKHRSPVGKLFLGSSAQQLLLEAAAPVLAVKAPR
ncbi:universal stress protein [Kocuria coralli]|uniref:Universal stress protein n=1 Tax=Kocuria coralli TaxID=1461025 RepID=A0A5J5KU76_9MICC|nr:universal stress protein [Kocuria coralli]KAA9393289.1 universal stress protein [Kocuria coralli]